MVAAHISQRGLSNKDFTIHETTVLPNIRGFGPLMAMVGFLGIFLRFCGAIKLYFLDLLPYNGSQT